jgi:hypothetical protein
MAADDIDEDLESIKRYIKTNPGCEYDKICANTHVEKKNVSLILHKLQQQMAIYKNGKGYTAIDVGGAPPPARAIPPVRQSVMSQPSPVIKNTSTATAPTPPKDGKQVVVDGIPKVYKDGKLVSAPVVTKPIAATVEKKYGNLRRTADKGVVAYFFYKNRLDSAKFGVKEIKALINLTSTASNILWTLTKEGFLDEFEIDDKPKQYRWSDKFIYPFKNVEPDDKYLIPEPVKTTNPVTVAKKPDEAPAATNPASVEQATNKFPAPGALDHKSASALENLAGVSKVIEDGKEKNKVVLSMINSRIETLNAELNHLTRMREVLSA